MSSNRTIRARVSSRYDLKFATGHTSLLRMKNPIKINRYEMTIKNIGTITLIAARVWKVFNVTSKSPIPPKIQRTQTAHVAINLGVSSRRSSTVEAQAATRRARRIALSRLRAAHRSAKKRCQSQPIAATALMKARARPIQFQTGGTGGISRSGMAERFYHNPGCLGSLGSRPVGPVRGCWPGMAHGRGSAAGPLFLRKHPKATPGSVHLSATRLLT